MIEIVMIVFKEKKIQAQISSNLPDKRMPLRDVCDVWWLGREPRSSSETRRRYATIAILESDPIPIIAGSAVSTFLRL
jgi:hypothetical protein